jgi:hypothetical protein
MTRRVLFVLLIGLAAAGCESGGSPHVDAPHVTTTMPPLAAPAAKVAVAQLPPRLRAQYAFWLASPRQNSKGYRPHQDAVFGVYHVESGDVYVDSALGGYAVSKSCAAMREWIAATRWSTSEGCLQ